MLHSVRVGHAMLHSVRVGYTMLERLSTVHVCITYTILVVCYTMLCNVT